MLVRQADSHDLDAMCQLLAQLFAIEVDFQVDITKQAAGLELPLQDDTPGRLFVAEVEGEVVDV